MDPRELLTDLSDPAAFPDGGKDVQVVQTHVSLVFLTGDRAYKVKKTVNLWGLIDYSTPEKRRFYCDEEIRLNRRTAPEVYLGVVPVVRRGGRLRIGGDGETVDWAVAMRRLPVGATLRERIAAGTTTPAEVGDVAKVVARMHEEGTRGPEIARHGRPVAFARVVHQNFLATKRGVPALFPRAAHEALSREMARLLRERRGLLARRFHEGRIVEAHGDLRAEHAVRLETPTGVRWRVIDALEFSPALRCLDPLSDAAFLAMDLASIGRRDLERAFLDAYRALEPDPAAAGLLPLFLSYRAHVRAKVDAHRAGLEEIPAAERDAARIGALRHFALAWTYGMGRVPPPLVVVMGPSGTGKSVVARSLSPLLDAEVFASDPTRRRLAGIGPTERLHGEALAALYSSEMSKQTYDAILAGAEAALRAGKAAILDATFLRRSSRAAALELGRRHGRPVAFVSVSADDEVVRERLLARAREGTDPSDATWREYQAQRAEAEGFAVEEKPHVIEHDGAEDPAEAIAPLLDLLAKSAAR